MFNVHVGWSMNPCYPRSLGKTLEFWYPEQCVPRKKEGRSQKTAVDKSWNFSKSVDGVDISTILGKSNIAIIDKTLIR